MGGCAIRPPLTDADLAECCRCDLLQPAEPRLGCGKLNFVVDFVLLAGPIIGNGVSQPKPAVRRIASQRLELNAKLVIIESKFHLVADMRARAIVELRRADWRVMGSGTRAPPTTIPRHGEVRLQPTALRCESSPRPERPCLSVGARRRAGRSRADALQRANRRLAVTQDRGMSRSMLK
jgi:hypothetical protein